MTPGRWTAAAGAVALLAAGWLAGARAASGSPTSDAEAIDALHRKDVAATLSGDPAALAELWTDDAVRLEQGRPADVGRAAIRAVDEKQRAEHPGARIAAYEPKFRDVTISGAWAVEWGTFTGRYVPDANAPEQEFSAKFMRVLRKQADGSWRFARVMWNTSD